MNREIKFRAWDKEDGKMVYDIQDAIQVRENYDYVLGNNPFFLFLMHGGFEVMQYTGLKDKNGIEIYEGDIVSLSFQKENPAGVQDERWYKRIVMVEWADGFAGFNPFCYQAHYQNDPKLIEVIGNIYENPELLEVKE